MLVIVHPILQDIDAVIKVIFHKFDQMTSRQPESNSDISHLITNKVELL